MKKFEMEVGITVYQMITVEAEDIDEAIPMSVEIAAENIGVETPTTNDSYIVTIYSETEIN